MSKALIINVTIDDTNAKPLIKSSWLFGIAVKTNALINGRKTTAVNPVPFVNNSTFPPI
jgi:hypothetical protein